MSLFTLSRFDQCVAALGIHTGTRAVFEALRAAYTEPGRFYHTTRHIEACLRHIVPIPTGEQTGVIRVAHLARAPREIEIALWFHDAVYDSHRSDNEERSAHWAGQFLEQAGAARDVQTRVMDLIMATKHGDLPSERDAQLLVDIDLAILGQPQSIFSQYNQQIRQEYAWVPAPLYRRKRRQVLQAFLARSRIYATEAFTVAFETRARQNLTWAIERL